MESGLLNFHDDENFSTSVYDQGELSGMDCHGSLLDMMHSDLQYNSDYLNHSTIHWDSDQEQEHNGDLAVLPTPPSECSSINSSKEDYHKVFFEWQEHLLSLQPLEPDDVDLRLDGQCVPEELPDNIFEDSSELTLSITGDTKKNSSLEPTSPLNRSSTPISPCCASSPSRNKSSVSVDGNSFNLNLSLSALDVDMSGVDVSALGIDVSALDLKSDTFDFESVKHLFPSENQGLAVKDTNKFSSQKDLPSGNMPIPDNMKSESVDLEHQVEACKLAKGSLSQTVKIEPVLSATDLPVSDKLSYLGTECPPADGPKTQMDVSTTTSLNMKSEPTCLTPALEAGNLESLLEQFEASCVSSPSSSQSVPNSPAHLSSPSFSQSMPASPSSVNVQTKLENIIRSAKRKITKTAGNPSLPAKWTSLLRSNNSNPSEKVDTSGRLKAVGKKKAVALIPALRHKKYSVSGSRMQDAAAALASNKFGKIASPTGINGESVQLDHDYCSNDSLPAFYHADPLEYIPQNLVLSIQANQRRANFDDDKSSRKDSGLESGEVSEDSEGAVIHSGGSSGCETASSSGSNTTLRPFKSKGSSLVGRTKDLLMVSVLKKTKEEIQKSIVVDCSAPSIKAELPPKAEGSSDVQSLVLQPSASIMPLAVNVQPKKRKLNLEEYRNRQKMLEREREKKNAETALSNTVSVKKEPCIITNTSESYETTKVDTILPANESLKVSSENPPTLAANEFAKHLDDRRRRRQYRVRHSSSSSQEGQDNIQARLSSEKMEASSKKKNSWSRSRSRSKLSCCSSTYSRSRSSSRSSASSCSSSSSNSSSTKSSIKSSSGRSSCSPTRCSSRSRERFYVRRSRSRSRRRYRRGRSRNRSRDSSNERRSDRNWKSRCHRDLMRFQSQLCGQHESHSYTSSSRSRSYRQTRRRSRSRSSHHGKRRSRSKSRSLGRRRRRDRSRKDSYYSRRSRSPMWRQQGNIDWFKVEKEHNRQVEERRVIYVGRIPDNITKADLHSRFEVFGPIIDISLHFREHADNYGFVTFAYKVDAYEAVEHGNDDPNHPRFDLCFGGRRKFCKERYADLDGMACEGDSRLRANCKEDNSFDQMLREVQAKLRDRKKL